MLYSSAQLNLKRWPAKRCGRVLGDVMKWIIFEITMLVVAVAFVVFLALDDRRNRRQREWEDRQKRLQKERHKDTSDERS